MPLASEHNDSAAMSLRLMTSEVTAVFNARDLYIEIDQNPKLHAQVEALVTFACAYKKRGIPFDTSWSTYSITATEEEQLINAILQTIENPNESHAILEVIPAIIAYYTARYQVTDTVEAIESVSLFIADMFKNLMLCDAREWGYCDVFDD